MTNWPSDAFTRKKDLRYEYKWEIPTDDDYRSKDFYSKRLICEDGFEVLTYLNELGFSEDLMEVIYGEGIDIPKFDRLYVEWMLKERLDTNTPNRKTATDWINLNWRSLRSRFKGPKSKKESAG